MNDVRFTPVRGTEAVILAMERKDGYVYYTTDTKRIYMDTATENKLPLGGAGNSGIYYGSKELSDDEKEATTITFILATEIEGDSLPNVNDLVLNAPDGCFYRVTEIAANQLSFTGQRLTVTGSGSSSGGGDGIISKATVSITKPSQSVFLYGQENKITITPKASKSTDGYVDDYLDLYWKVKAKDDSTLYTEGVVENVSSNVAIEFEFGSKLYADKQNILEFWTVGYNSGTQASHNTYEVKCVQLQLLENDDFNALKLYTGSATLACEVYGAIEKNLEFWVDGVCVETKNLDATNQSQGRQTYTVTDLTHGTHSVEIKLYQALSDGSNGSSVPSLTYEIASKTTGNNTPIIWLGSYQSTYENYEQITIPFMAWNPTTGDSCQVKFYKDNNELAISPATITFNSNTTEFETLEITDATCPTKTGEKSYNTYYIYCGNTSKTINFYVHQSGKMVLAAQDNLLVKFDAAGRSNNESTLTRNVWSYTGKNDTTYTGTFTDFNWYNNGWIKDSDGNTCLRISNGAKFSINLGNTVFNGTEQGSQSHTYEFEFKVRNVQNYEKLIKLVTRYSYPDDGAGHSYANDDAWYAEYTENQQSNYDSYDQYLQAWLPTQGMSYDNLEYSKVESITSTDTAFCTYYDTTRATGFCLGTQDAFFKTNKSTLNANYVEDKIINLALVFSQANKLVSIYLNGILSGAAYVSDDSAFQVAAGNVIFNSDYCDIDLYKFRVYNTGFAISEVLNNYSIDLRDTQMYAESTALSKYNSTIKEYQLDYNAMLTYNDEHEDEYLMPYFVFSNVQGDALPYSKLDEKSIDMMFVNTGLDHDYASGQLAKDAATANYPTATYPIYYIKAADAAEALASESSTSGYTIQKVKNVGTEDEPEYENDGSQIALDFSKIDTTKCVRKAKDGYYIIYRTLNQVQNYYLHHGASFSAAGTETKTQGTSSQFYPRRNYKSKCKNIMMADRGPFADDPFPMDWFFMDNDTVGCNKFTLKIDYMESSGSYNTGAANLVANAYTKHPIDDYAEIASKCITDDLRTSVQGFPAMAFHKKSDGTYTYIGRYNINIDKGSDECYGYKLFTNNDLYTAEKVKTPYVLKDGKAQKVADIAECWEFSDNNRGYCSFRDPLGRSELSFDYPAVSGNKSDAAAGYHLNANGSCPVVADSFEYRYSPVGDMLDYLYNPADPGLDIDGIKEDFEVDDATMTNMTWRKNYLLGKMANWEKACKWVWSTCTDNVGSEDKVFESYANKSTTDVTTYYGAVTKVTYDTEGDGTSFGSADVLVFDVELDADGEVVPKTTTYTDALADIATKMGITTAEVLAADSLVTTTYGVKDEDNSTSTVTVKKLLTDNVFEAYADLNGYEYYDYSLDATSGAAIGNFRKGTIKLRSEVLQTIQANPSDYSYVQTAGTFTSGDVVALTTAYTTGGTTYYFDTKEYRLAKFKNEFTKHFDKEYTLTYFVITEVLMCYDSRGKNCMMASWGPQEVGGDYIWYPVFYDMDTQLGINNTGIPSFEYYVNATEDGCFSTNDSVLWGNIYKCFLDDIKSTYQSLRTSIKRGSSSVNIAPFAGSIDYFGQDPVEHIENWYNCDPDACDSICMQGHRPLISKNFDEYYKYISIMNEYGPGYQGTDGNPKYDEGGSFLYALQGDRSLSRQQFLSRRINFIDSWLNRGNYAEGTGSTIKFRTSANDPTNTSDKWVDATSTVNSSGQEVEGLVANAGYYGVVYTLNDDNEYIGADSTKLDGTTVYKKVNNAWVVDVTGVTVTDGDVTGTKVVAREVTDMYGDQYKAHELDANAYIKVSPFQRSYVTLATDNAPLPSIEYEGSPVRLDFPANVVTGVRTSPQYAEQLLYVYGASYLKDIGDVSLLYPREFELKGATQLQKIILGNDTDGYFNKKLKSPQFDAAYSKTGTTGKPLLKEVVFTNVQIDGNTNVSLDFSSSEKLKIFRALGMNLSAVTFADGVALHTLHMPATITELVLKEARNLKGLITSYTAPTKDSSGNWNAQTGLYIKGLTDATDDELASSATTNITKLQIAGGNMNYDSYDLLKKLYTIKERDGKTLSISLTDVNWTPYTNLSKGTTYVASSIDNYYIDNGHYQLVPYKTYRLTDGTYVFNQTQWNLDLSNGVVWYKDPSITEATINKIGDNFGTNDLTTGFLKRLALEKLTDGATEKYTNTDETNNSIPTLSGNIYVNNTSADEIEESYIQDTIINTWYPDLNIFFNNVKKAYSLKFVMMNDDGVSYTVVDTDKISQAAYNNGSGTKWFKNPYDIALLSTDMDKTGWDFYGWSTEKDNKEKVIDETAWTSGEGDACIVADQFEYILYAVYEKHKYEFKFLNDDNNYIKWDQTVDDTTSEVSTLYVTFGEKLTNPPIIPSSTQTTEDEEVYKFLGFSRTASGDVVDLTSITSAENLTFYARYGSEKISVYDNDYFATNAATLFDFTSTTYTDPYDSDTYSVTTGGWTISPKSGVQLTGKVTIPATYNNKPILKLANFASQKITHLYFDADSELRMINASAFSGNKTIEMIGFPDSLRDIASEAFFNCTALRIESCGKNIARLQSQAFAGAFKKRTGAQFQLSGSIKSLGSGCLKTLGTPFDLFEIGTSTQPVTFTAKPGSQWFVQNSKTATAELRVWCADSVTANYFLASKNDSAIYYAELVTKLPGES